MSALDQFSYLFFVCEGKNEEAIVKWLAEADAIDFPKKQYSLDFCRARTKSTRPKILRAATQFDYGGPVAIIYVCDSHGEKWSVGKDCMGNEIPVIKIVTSPEIEILLVHKAHCIEKWKSARAKNPKLHVSAFCKQMFKMDVKNGENFVQQFSSVKDFKKICLEYKSASDSRKFKNELTWYDLLK
ncbi:hypothetical protein [Acidaminococcus fermentans]